MDTDSLSILYLFWVKGVSSNCKPSSTVTTCIITTPSISNLLIDPYLHP